MSDPREKKARRESLKFAPNRPFPSEKLLQQAIAGLLVRMPDTSGVQILQGAQELGKDLVFYIKGGFGEQVLCACVVKNQKITGDAGKSVGARTIFAQASQAFDSPHTDESGKEVFVERVYIVTPYDLPPATIASIKGLLRERAGLVIFIGGARLFDNFKQYWPDFLADEANALEHHLKHTSDRFEEDNPLLKLASQYHLGNVDPRYRKIYVSQTFHRELRSFSLGPILQESIPTEQMLVRRWTISDVRQTQTDLKRLTDGLTFLDEWDQLEEIPQRLNEVLDSITLFHTSIQRSFTTGLKRKRKILSTKEVKSFKQGEEVYLDRSKELIRQSLALSRQLHFLLCRLITCFSLLKDIVIRPRAINPVDLTYDQFNAICSLNECAARAPSGLLESHEKIVVSLPKDMHNRWEGCFMIVGAPGFGKTSFCRWHALQDVENYTSQNSDVLPVYVPLHRLAKGPLESFAESFLKTLGESALLSHDSTTSRGKPRIRVYLDGLDELSSPTRRQEIIRITREAVKSNSTYQVVLTARDHVEGVWLNWMPRISLSGFDESAIIELVRLWFDKDTAGAKRFYNQLRVLPSLKNLMSTPLLATLIILVFRQTGRLPESRTKLYDMFIDLLFGGWDLAKGILRESTFGPRVKMMALTTLASDLHESERREFGDAQIRTSIESIFSNKGLVDWKTFCDELVEDGLISRSGDVSQFAHLSFQEFLTAKSLMGDPQPRRVRRALEAFLTGKNWWREVLRFYIGLSTKPREITLWLLSEIDRITNQTSKIIKDDKMEDLFVGVVEAFPEFSIRDVIDSGPNTIVRSATSRAVKIPRS